MQRSRFAVALCFAVSTITASSFAAETAKTTDVTRDKLGQDITLEGKVSSFRASKGERSPNSFMLKDAAGEIRVVIWPDVFAKIATKDALQKDGAQVKVEGEVAEYREKVEVHVKKAEGVTASGGAAPAAASAATTATAVKQP